MSVRADSKHIRRKAFGLAISTGSRRGFTLTEILAVIAILSLITVSLFTMFQQGTEVWRQSSARTEAYIKARQILDMMAREIKGAVLITAARGPRADPDMPMNELKRADFVGLNGKNDDGAVTLQGWRTPQSPPSKEQAYSDQIYFVAPVMNSGRQELCVIGYWVKDADGETRAPLTQTGVPGNSKDDGLWPCFLTDGAAGAPVAEWRAFDFSSRSLNSWSNLLGEVAGTVRQLDIKYYDYEKRGPGAPVLNEYYAWDSLPSSEGGTTRDNYDDNKLPAAVRITVTVGDKDDIVKGIKLSTIVYLENARKTIVGGVNP